MEPREPNSRGASSRNPRQRLPPERERKESDRTSRALEPAVWRAERSCALSAPTHFESADELEQARSALSGTKRARSDRAEISYPPHTIHFRQTIHRRHLPPSVLSFRAGQRGARKSKSEWRRSFR